MKLMEKLQKVLADLKSGKVGHEGAQNEISLDRGMFDIAVEESLCVVCAKWKTCVVRNPVEYTRDGGKCTWFEAVERKAEIPKQEKK